MAVDPKTFLLVSCRHCLRPITLAYEIDELEVGALRGHLRGCGEMDADRAGLGVDDVLEHYWVAAA